MMFAEYDGSDAHLPLEIMQSVVSEEIQRSVQRAVLR
jgi:hypothetical protein